MLSSNPPLQYRHQPRIAPYTWSLRRRRPLPHPYAYTHFPMYFTSLFLKSYAAAQADAVPPYWDTIMHAPSGIDTDAGMIVGDLASGSILAFISTLFVSFSFQFISFLLTYLLPYYTRRKVWLEGWPRTNNNPIWLSSHSAADDILPRSDGKAADVLMLSAPPSSSAPMPQDNTIVLSMSPREWLSFLFLITLGTRYLSSFFPIYLLLAGWFLLLSSLVGFWRIENW
jgi:hypothetical protein